jgi:uncharacterized protein involved in cysteine biosynthesis
MSTGSLQSDDYGNREADMSRVVTALARALRDLREPRILAILFVPALIALALWAVLAWLYWDAWSAWLRGMVTATAVGRWLEGVGAGWLTQSFSVLALVALWVPATLITVVVIAELVAMPVIVSSVAGRCYDRLERKAGGTVAGSLWNMMVGVAVFAMLWSVTLPLWLTGFAAFMLPPLLSAYLGQRLFRYDALAEHASPTEYRAVIAAARTRLFLLGLALAVLFYVPLVNFIAPVLSGLAFTHYCLDELERLRQPVAVAGAGR